MRFLLKILFVTGMSSLLVSCSLLSAAGLSSQGQPVKQVSEDLGSTTESQDEENESDYDLDHSDWDELLKKFVAPNGLVDYKGLQSERESLQRYLYMLSENPPTEYWTVEELLVYYINIYNAYTVELILENYPVESIKDINGPWTRGIVAVGNKNLSLGGIENGILRKMNEPRIHFAINCASISCPKLLNEAFVPERIDEQLDRVTIEFINGNKNDISEDEAVLSSIFDWYSKDFKVDGKLDVIGYINRYSEVQIFPSAKISFKNYDWNLNEQR